MGAGLMPEKCRIAKCKINAALEFVLALRQTARNPGKSRDSVNYALFQLLPAHPA
jgi:hypothetical protein